MIEIDLDAIKLDHLLRNKLSDLLKEKGINRSQLSRESGIPYSTIDGFFQKGMSNIKLSTLLKLAKFFNVPMSHFFEEDDKSDEMTEFDKELLLERMELMEKKLGDASSFKLQLEHVQTSLEFLCNSLKDSSSISILQQTLSNVTDNLSNYPNISFSSYSNEEVESNGDKS